MPSPTVELRKLSLSADKLSELPAQCLYVFALAGHVFNELMMLQKMVLTARPPEASHQFARDAGVDMAMFYLRLLVGKTEEAMKALSKHSTDTELRASILSRVPGLTERWIAAVTKYKDMPWLGRIRNQRSFHYMNATQWLPHIDAGLMHDGYVVVGKTYGNTLFHWHEICASVPMLKLVNEDAPFDGLGQMLDEAGELLGDITSCLAEGLQTFMMDVLTNDDAHGEPEALPAELLENVCYGYFHATKQE